MRDRLRKRMFRSLVLIGIFGISVALRLPSLRGPIRFRHELWLTAIELSHLEIWRQEGISQSHGAPILTYAGNANRHINNQQSLRLQMDAEGDYYYTSYPPFNLYFLHAIFGLLRITPSVAALRILNLVWHFVSAVFIYLILTLLLNETEKAVSFPALCGFVVYLFSPETLWVQSNLYFCDVFAHVLFVAGTYFLLRRISGRSRGKLWPLFFGIFTFFFAYTDWIGVLVAFGVFALSFIYRKYESLRWLGVAMAAAAAAALLLTFVQYSLIAGPREFLEFAAQKYLYRSGLGHEVAAQAHLWSWRSWLWLVAHYVRGYIPDFALITFWLLLKGEGRVPGFPREVRAALFFTLILPVVLHHLAFFNFTVVHDFSVLKAAPSIAIVAGLVAASLWRVAESTLHNRIVQAAILISLAVSCVWGIHMYEMLLGPPSYGYKTIGDTIAQNARSDEVVFIEYPAGFVATHPDAWEEPYPALMFYAHRNIAPWSRDEDAARLVRENGLAKAVVFTVTPDGSGVAGVRRISY